MHSVGAGLFINTVVMITGIRTTVFLTLFVIFGYNISAQELDCYSDCIQLNYDEIFFITTDYLVEDPSDSIIILIDFSRRDTLNIYRVLGTNEAFTIFYKSPDCYTIYRNSIIYVFTENYNEPKESVWKELVFSQTCRFLNFPHIKVNWMSDSIEAIDGSFSDYGQYDPVAYEYIFRNGMLISKSVCDKMLYPETGNLKGIKTYRPHKTKVLKE